MKTIQKEFWIVFAIAEGVYLMEVNFISVFDNYVVHLPYFRQT